MSVKDMVLHCCDYGLMRRLSGALVKEYSADYTFNTHVEYVVMRKEFTPNSSLYTNLTEYYDFYKQSDELWDCTKNFYGYTDMHNVILVLYFDECVVFCHDVKTHNYIDNESLYLYSPLYVSWKNVECFLKGE